MKNITKKKLIETFNNNELEKAILADIFKDILSYSGTFKKKVIIRASEICDYGCISGTVGKLIYHSDCKKFYIEHMDDIHNLLQEKAYNDGGKISLPNDKPLPTFFAWAAYEEVAYQILTACESGKC